MLRIRVIMGLVVSCCWWGGLPLVLVTGATGQVHREYSSNNLLRLGGCVVRLREISSWAVLGWTYTVPTPLGAAWPGPTWPCVAGPRLTWLGLSWFDWAWYGRAQLGLAWLGLAWPSLAGPARPDLT